MKRLLMRFIAFARRVLFHTPIGRSAFVARIYRLVFAAAAPDLSKPVSFRGCRFYVDPQDRTWVPGIVGGFYEARELDIFEQIVGEADVLFDVGANVGVYSVLGCARHLELRAFAFEPVAENREILARNLSLNHVDQRVSIEPVAVSDRSGTATISLAASGTHSLSAQRDGATREVETLTLDEFYLHHQVTPDLIKIDVEGHEAAVLDGARMLLEQTAPTLFMEFSPRQHGDLDGLLHRLSSSFDACFMVDEISGQVVEMAIHDLDRGRDCNIVLASEPRHVARLRSLAGG
jgi:FkbM family methyltransferase